MERNASGLEFTPLIFSSFVLCSLGEQGDVSKRSGGACGTSWLRYAPGGPEHQPCRELAFWCQVNTEWKQHRCLETTYVFKGDDVRVLAVPQENLNLFRGVSFTLINNLG